MANELAIETFPCRIASITKITPGYCAKYRAKAKRLARKGRQRNPRKLGLTFEIAEEDDLKLGLSVCLTCPGAPYNTENE